MNHYKKVALIWSGEDVSLEIYYESLSTCFVQTTGGDESSLNGKSEIPNKILDNTTRDIILKSCHKKEPWWFTYKYDICISHRNYNRLCGDITYLLRNL